jgi:hypothetical protein
VRESDPLQERRSVSSAQYSFSPRAMLAGDVGDDTEQREADEDARRGHTPDFYDPVRELEVCIAAAWQAAEEWADLARRHRRDAHKNWSDVWRRRMSMIGPIERQLNNPDYLAYGLVLLCLEQRHFAILKMRQAVRYALELEGKLTAGSSPAGCASGAVGFSGEGPEPRTSEVSVCGADVPSCRDAGASSEVAR